MVIIMLMQIPQEVNTAIKALEAEGFCAYAVGGAVRDCLRGESASDWDIASSALPKQVEAVFADCRVIETGIKHGTVTVIVGKMPIEITTLRIDGDYTDNRRPDSVEFTSDITADLSRRDFTVNAIAYSPSRGILDPFGGESDIKSGIIRCVGKPERRFNEDGLRIMRALRFASTLGYRIEEETANAITRNRSLLRNIAAERIAKELLKLLCGRAAAQTMREFPLVMFEIIPELQPLFGCAQNHPYHIYDVWEHTLHSVDACPASEEIRLAMLLHDIGKPLCRITDENGIDHFPNHGERSEEIAREVLRRLKLSNKICRDVETLVKYHDIQSEYMEAPAFRKWLGVLGEKYFMMLFDIKRADISAQAPQYRNRLELCDTAQAKAEKIIANGECLTLSDLAVNGRDVQRAGFCGEQIGKVLNAMLELVLCGKVQNEKAQLIEQIKKYPQE